MWNPTVDGWFPKGRDGQSIAFFQTNRLDATRGHSVDRAKPAWRIDSGRAYMTHTAKGQADMTKT
jgi:hypothetical protein